MFPSCQILKSPEDAGEYGDNVISAFLNKGKNLTVNGLGNNFNSIPTSKLPKEVRDKLHSSIGNYARTDDISYAAKEAGYDTASFDNVYDNASGEIPLKPKAKKDEAVSQDLLDLLDEFEASGMGNNSANAYLAQDIPKNYDPTTVDVRPRY